MSKLKVKLKIQGFELEIEGSREDVPNIATALGAQISNIIGGSVGVSEEDKTPRVIGSTIDAQPTRRKRLKSYSKSQNGTDPSESVNYDWPHDSSKFGTPSQEWNTLNKALWTLYVMKEVLDKDQFTASAVAAAFNKKFKQAKTISPSNVSRDFGFAKIKKGDRSALVGDDTTKNPIEWYLTENGVVEAQKLIKEN